MKNGEFFSPRNELDMFYTIFCNIFSQPVWYQILSYVPVILIRKGGSIYETILGPCEIFDTKYLYFDLKKVM